MSNGATTPSQTVGPYLHIGLPWADGPYALAESADGGIWIRGTLYDGAGDPVPDGLIETWQADPDGRFDHPDDPRGARSWPGFRGFGRCETDAAGRFGIRTLKPGPVPGADGALQAPHIDVSVFARGMLHRTVTRIYFPEETRANAADPVLAAVPESLRATLVARAAEDGAGSASEAGDYVFDIRLQGSGETVFFDI
ncbi:protocatechuate 3,4-dioxygenase subunit alpha [Streptomonospora salina]|uniref:Protocatechuate 3,4-dioxygenase alpha subunit n=1 Tax=Streptomonospora salina TaxID=104205 RepID=A0A841E719_9ACTN|nr:protocatechuate 3,4-dioxygenase subunit alpha [Streptomonospora salina]MBB5997099.1 protocatechuate 3,4-dioxygenase alpha subunit [Streptomonospora salina]